MNYKQEYIKELSEKIKAQGFRVFIGKSGTHGFYTNRELKGLVSFQCGLGGISFSGNYKTDNPRQTGQGWRIADSDSGNYEGMINTYPPSWAVRDSKWNFKTVKQYLKEYQRSSKFKEFKIKPLEWSELWDAMKKNPEKWQPTTETMYYEMLEALPPQDMTAGAFLVGEPDHHNGEGAAVYACFKTAGKGYEARYLTQKQFITLATARQLNSIK